MSAWIRAACIALALLLGACRREEAPVQSQTARAPERPAAPVERKPRRAAALTGLVTRPQVENDAMRSAVERVEDRF
ncbi:MAG TPA: hypothetical protein VEK11_22870 [Thermoanaerobaculia bacterium]|nr:hypothetical protein [Thermoanaerobaculia bacterium]